MLQHLHYRLAALHVRLVNDNQVKRIEPVISLLVASARQQRLLAGDHNLCGRSPAVVGGCSELRHFELHIVANNLAALTHRLPNEFSQWADDERPPRQTAGERCEYHGLASPGEQGAERRPQSLSHGQQDLVNNFCLIVTQFHLLLQ